MFELSHNNSDIFEGDSNPFRSATLTGRPSFSLCSSSGLINSTGSLVVSFVATTVDLGFEAQFVLNWINEKYSLLPLTTLQRLFKLAKSQAPLVQTTPLSITTAIQRTMNNTQVFK